MDFYKDENLIKTLKEGGVVVMPTDTIYGVVGRAENKETVDRIYKIKKRSPEKKLIILISSWEETKKFGINSSQYKKRDYDEPTTFVIENTAFRIPKDADLRNLLSKTGPLVAPSANPEGLLPAKNIEEAKNYFGDAVDLYVDGGEISGKASKLIKLREDGGEEVLRP